MGARWHRIRPWSVVAVAATAAFLALLPIELTLRSPDSRVDDLLAPAATAAALAQPGDGVLFIPAARRVTPPAPRTSPNAASSPSTSSAAPT